MKFQITLECFSKPVDKNQIVNECMQYLMAEVQRSFTHMNPQAVNALGTSDNKPPVGFRQ